MLSWKGPAKGAEGHTRAEREVIRACRDVLNIDRVGADDDFLSLGGNSLSAAVLANRLGERLGVRPSMRTLFDAKSLAELAAALGPEESPTSVKGGE